ncbi:MAG: hypothetical protein ACWGQW_00580 [bacterium]
MPEDLEVIEQMLKDAVIEGIVECPDCGERMEPDCSRCPECGKPNPLRAGGYI